MWTLKKPSLDEATGEDIDNLILHCDALSDTDKPHLKTLYEQYDHQLGSVTDAQHNRIPAAKAQAIKRQYYKTDRGQDHYYLRCALEADVHRCPYCSINQPGTLDHYMPKSEYPALSMCRMNLVPMCWDCNRKKNDYSYSQFIHAYYQAFPNIAFLKATAKTHGNRIVISFFLDKSVVTDLTLLAKLQYQVDKIDLIGRINKAASSFVEELCFQCHCFLGLGFKLWLKNRLEDHVRIFGINDWRTAAIQAIIDSPEIDYRLFKAISGGAVDDM